MILIQGHLIKIYTVTYTLEAVLCTNQIFTEPNLIVLEHRFYSIYSFRTHDSGSDMLYREEPVHRVIVSHFFLVKSKSEITRERVQGVESQWRAVRDKRSIQGWSIGHPNEGAGKSINEMVGRALNFSRVSQVANE